MLLRTVLKVDISCLKCKRKIFKALASLKGIDAIEADVDKCTVTVTGNADPCKIIVLIRKAAATYAEVVSVGPPPETKPPDKPKDKEKSPPIPVPHTCPICQRLVYWPVYQCYELNPWCSIL